MSRVCEARKPSSFSAGRITLARIKEKYANATRKAEG